MDESGEELEQQKQDAIYDALKKEKEQIAKKMIKENCDIELILKVTGLSEKDVSNIKLKYMEDVGKASEKE